MIKILRGGWVLLFIFSVAQTSYASDNLSSDKRSSDENSNIEFSRAIAAFQAGNFKSASRAFERARKQGLDTPALNYNLGVTYYQLKQYNKSRRAFERAAEENRWQALAYYNMGLIAYRQKNNTEAQKYARKVLKLFADDKLATLALKLLRRASPPESGGYWVAQVNIGLGYDSNVALTNNQSALLATNDSDFFIDTSARISKNIMGGSYDGLQIYGGVYRTEYLRENSFDLTGIEGGISKNFQVGKWDLDLGGSWEYLDLDANPFYRTGEFTAVGAIGDQKHNGLNLAYRLKRFDENDADFEYLKGWQTAFTVASAYKFRELQARYGYDLKIDRRNDLQMKGEEFSFSPTTHSLFANFGYKFNHGWQASVNIELGSAKYNTEDSRNGQAPVTRQDTYYEIILQGVRELTSSWRAVAELRHVNNKSNIDEFDYERSLVTISANWRF